MIYFVQPLACTMSENLSMIHYWINLLITHLEQIFVFILVEIWRWFIKAVTITYFQLIYFLFQIRSNYQTEVFGNQMDNFDSVPLLLLYVRLYVSIFDMTQCFILCIWCIDHHIHCISFFYCLFSSPQTTNVFCTNCRI